jgi:hypothetical protein
MNRRYGVKIARPCPRKWENLKSSGSCTSRYCDACQLHVHDLSAMNPRERRAFLAQPGRKCGALVIPVTRRQSHLLRRTGLILASMLALFLPACATSREKEQSCPLPAVEDKNIRTVEDGKSMMTVGMIVTQERPLWKRILWPWN